MLGIPGRKGRTAFVTQYLPLRQVEERDDGGLLVVCRILRQKLLRAREVLVSEVEIRGLLVVRRISVLPFDIKCE